MHLSSELSYTSGGRIIQGVSIIFQQVAGWICCCLLLHLPVKSLGLHMLCNHTILLDSQFRSSTCALGARDKCTTHLFLAGVWQCRGDLARNAARRISPLDPILWKRRLTGPSSLPLIAFARPAFTFHQLYFQLCCLRGKLSYSVFKNLR